MSLPFDKILVKHWVRSHAHLVCKLFNDENVVKKDWRMFYVKMKDSLHVRTLINNDYAAYNEYVITAGQPDHSEEKFKKLISEFSLDKMEKIKIVVDDGNFVVNDGVHRIAILFLKHGLTGVLPIRKFTIDYPSTIVDEIGSALKNTTEIKHYNGWNNARKEYGYHSFSIYNIEFVGQRDPVQRLNEMRKFFNFEGKYVMDFGSNSGGMLFHLDEIKKGLGIEFDENCISACNTIKNKLGLFDHIDFVKRDIQKDSIVDIFEGQKPDVIFLLSLGSWLTNWKHLYRLAIENTGVIFLETNNDMEGKQQIDFFKNMDCSIELVIENSSDDCTGNKLRKTYKITTPLT